jgi:hypothetical protein
MIGTSLNRKKLVKTLGMLGSEHDGEIAAAGRAADKLVREAGLRWPDIVAPALPPPRQASNGWRDPEHLLAIVLDNAEFLSEWEFNFVTSIRQHRQRRRPLSSKQFKVLEQIFDKVRQTAAGAA